MRLNYIYFDEDIGYGISARELVQALRSEITVYETRLITSNPSEGGYVLQDKNRDDIDGVIIHTMPEYFPYWLKKRKAVNPWMPVWGYTTWETDQLPSHWPELLNQMDGIFVTSEWNKDVFLACGVRCPIQVLPHISQFHGQAPSTSSTALRDVVEACKGKFVFYHIGAWSERKATDELLHAYYKEFSSDEDVLLILKTGERDWSSYKPRWKRWRRAAYLSTTDKFEQISQTYQTSANVIHVNDALSEDDIAMLHSVGDCFVSLTKGEGWGMGAYEAGWFGKTVAITGFSGHLDFLPEDFSYHIPYQLRAVYNMPQDKKSYQRNQHWAYVKEEDARRVLRMIVENKQIAQMKGDKLSTYLHENFSVNQIISKCLEVFR